MVVDDVPAGDGDDNRVPSVHQADSRGVTTQGLIITDHYKKSSLGGWPGCHTDGSQGCDCVQQPGVRRCEAITRRQDK